MELLRIADGLTRSLRGMRFPSHVACVYNPLAYARLPYREYVRRYGRSRRDYVFLGMNPGPFGMAQTGVPFGEVGMVRDWLGISATVHRPRRQHPRRPVLGFDCPRREVSGARLWSWARGAFGTPRAFFRRFYVANYCPLCFLDDRGRNLTPDRLPVASREMLFRRCDEALRRTIRHFRPRQVIAIGAFAESRAREALDGMGVGLARIPHPSPASPAANRGWSNAATRALRAAGIPWPA
jgi:single-strand selective monofunctional uracil DNA glycosylase